MIKDVLAFYQKYGLLVQEAPGKLTQRKLRERMEFLLEELMELAEAGGLDVEVRSADAECPHEEGLAEPDTNAFICKRCEAEPRAVVSIRPARQDLPLQADALVDLVYVALGTVVMLGLTDRWQSLWNDVHRANMSKVRGVGKRGHAVDLIKPAGWVGPKTAEIIGPVGEGEADDNQG